MVKKKYVFEIRNSNKVLIKTKLKLKNLLKKIKYMILIKKNLQLSKLEDYKLRYLYKSS